MLKITYITAELSRKICIYWMFIVTNVPKNMLCIFYSLGIAKAIAVIHYFAIGGAFGDMLLLEQKQLL